MRLFVGIALADAVARELAAVVARLRDEGRGQGRRDVGMRWRDAGSWHITLQFLGNTTPEQLECLKARLAEVRSEAVPVQVGELGSFDRARILFADVTVTPGLADLQQRVVAATSRCGFVAEDRPFHPHITLARRTGNKGPREQGKKETREPGSERASGQKRAFRELLAGTWRQRAFTRFMAEEFLLYESHLGPGGSRYEVRARFVLNRT